MSSVSFVPVFKGIPGLGNSEIVLANDYFVFDNLESLEEANNTLPFETFFPFPVTYVRNLKIEGGFEGVRAVIAGTTEVYIISGEVYDEVD